MLPRERLDTRDFQFGQSVTKLRQIAYPPESLPLMLRSVRAQEEEQSASVQRAHLASGYRDRNCRVPQLMHWKLQGEMV
jgi:hypothetical protein